MSTVQVIIADDHPLFRTALKQAVQETLPDSYIKEANDFKELILEINNSPMLEVVFLDLHMPGNDGFKGLTQLQNNHPDLIVIMVSSDEKPEIIRKSISFGAAAFIPKSANLVTIAKALNEVIKGEIWIPDNIDVNLGSEHLEQYKLIAKQLSQLTPQQFTVLSMIADGKLNKQIGYMLDIKENTVKKHVSAILLQLGINNRTQAGLVYQQLMLTTPQNEMVD